MFNLYTLDNGLRVVTEYIEHVNSISVGIMVQNGSRNETKDENGISHFIEHMFFKGTDKRNAKEIVQEIENIGGQINAYTSKETTCYYIKALNTHVDLCLDVISDIHSEAIFGNNSLAYPILGTADKIKSFNRKKIKNYIKTHYTPYNSVLSICGKFDEKELKKLIEEYFGKWSKDNVYNPTYESVILNSDSKYCEKQIEQVHINLGLNGLAYADDKAYSLVLLNNIFGGGASSILFQKVREELGLCYSIYSYMQPYLGVGTMNIYTGLSNKYADKAISVINEQLQKFAKEGISDELLEINKEKIKANYILGLESTSSRMFANAKCVLLQNKIKTQEDVINRINKIDKHDISYVLERCFKPGIISTAFVGQGVETDKLNSILENSKVAYKNSIDKKFLL